MIALVALAWAGEATDAAAQKRALINQGAALYQDHCSGCHQADGKGIPGYFPPLLNNAVVIDPDPKEQLGIILKGLSGRVIDGVVYPTTMPAWAQLSDEQIAAIATWERNAWGHDAGMVTPAQVKAARK